MRRILVLIIVGAVAAMAIWYAVRLSEQSPSTAVSALLPRETIAFAHLPDFNRARGQWHQSDVYQLYWEPSVQEFLRKPLSRVPKRDATAQTLREIEQLDPKDAFVAITSIDNNNPKLVGGFRFRGSQANAEKIISKWRRDTLTKRQYEQHEIHLVGNGLFTVETVFDGQWFFASNSAAALESLLDRADHRAQDRQSTLEADKNFRAAMIHLPASYAISFYLQPKIFADRLASLRAADGRNVPPDERTMLEQVHSISGATRFEHGKIHDILFVGMPKLEDAKLTRSSVKLGTKDTFLYLAMLLNLGQKLDAFNQTSGSAAVASGWQKTLQSYARSGVTAEDWKAAFGVELGALAEWPSSARSPWLFLTFSVQDAARAGKIIEALTAANQDEATWTQTEKNGVRYFSMVSAASLVAITPTIALSDRIMIAGVDPISVEAAIKRSQSDSPELVNSTAYENAARLVPAPTNFFTYIDVPLLYSRVDATLRPMLFMSAAFLPWLADYVDLKKLPPAEVITKHLSPVVSSQRYANDGYVAESVGSITLNQSGAGLGAFSAFATMAYRRGLDSSLNALAPATSPTPHATPAPRSLVPTPTNTP